MCMQRGGRCAHRMRIARSHALSSIPSLRLLPPPPQQHHAMDGQCHPRDESCVELQLAGHRRAIDLRHHAERLIGLASRILGATTCSVRARRRVLPVRDMESHMLYSCACIVCSSASTRVLRRTVTSSTPRSVSRPRRCPPIRRPSSVAHAVTRTRTSLRMVSAIIYTRSRCSHYRMRRRSISPSRS
jgi:hypothetical protein